MFKFIGGAVVYGFALFGFYALLEGKFTDRTSKAG